MLILSPFGMMTIARLVLSPLRRVTRGFLSVVMMYLLLTATTLLMATADVSYIVSEVDGDVEIQFSGFLDWDVVNGGPGPSCTLILDASTRWCSVIRNDFSNPPEELTTFDYPVPATTGDDVSMDADFCAGDGWIGYTGALAYAPPGYIPGDPIFGCQVFYNTDFATMGIVDGGSATVSVEGKAEKIFMRTDSSATFSTRCDGTTIAPTESPSSNPLNEPSSNTSQSPSSIPLDAPPSNQVGGRGKGGKGKGKGKGKRSSSKIGKRSGWNGKGKGGRWYGKSKGGRERSRTYGRVKGAALEWKKRGGRFLRHHVESILDAF